MDAQTFGRNLAAIRRRTYDAQTLRPLTQEDVAERVGCGVRVVQNIEQGTRKHIDAQTRVALADALGLNTQERNTFFALPSQVKGAEMVRFAQPPIEVLTQQLERLARQPLPSALYDPFYNIVAVNRTGVALHGVAEADLDALLHERGAIHYLRLVFDPQSPLPAPHLDYWRRFVKLDVHQFRAMSLPYRYTDDFEMLFDELVEFEGFFDYWLETQGTEEDFVTQLKRYAYQHPHLGALDYEASMDHVDTACGKLYASTLLPQDEGTIKVFTVLHERVGSGVKHLSPWPRPVLCN